MLKSLFGGKKRKGKSVNDIRKSKKSTLHQQPIAQEVDLETRIKARKAKNLRHGEIKAALAGAGHVPLPDIAGAVNSAKALTVDSNPKDHKAAIERALRLRGSARVIDGAMAHPAWRYVAMAIIRGLLEDTEPESRAVTSRMPKDGTPRPKNRQ